MNEVTKVLEQTIQTYFKETQRMPVFQEVLISSTGVVFPPEAYNV